jgi:pimeloyl-ACP methyl ester carboxylesterase
MQLMRLIGKVFTVCVVMVALVIVTGVSWNFFALRRLRAQNPPPGRFYMVGGKSMHLNCAGTGTRTIVAEAGSGEDSLTWILLQNSLSRTYRFCSYDRAGTGWSEPQPGVRDAMAISSQLHELLKTAHEQGPFVLLGHSLGGLYIREYAQQYPSDISALIFLDAATPGAYEGKAADALGLGQSTLRQLTTFSFPVWAMEVSGYARLKHLCSDFPPILSSIQGLFKADQCIPSQDAEQRYEAAALPSDEREVSNLPGTLPVLVLSEDKSPVLQTPEAFTTWNMLQDSLLRLYPKSYRVIAANSDHFLQTDCPNFTSDQILAFLEPTQDGSVVYSKTTTGPCR